MGLIADEYQRMMAALLPPGRLWRFVDSLLIKLLAGSADELERLHQRAYDLLGESNPASALELLPEYEEELDLESTGTTAERRGRVIARLVARQRFRPVDFQTALAPLLGQLPADVVVIERSRAQAIALGNDREIYRFFIYRNPGAPGAYYLASAQALVDKIKPSHTMGHVVESLGFICDNPMSLCDRDVLGA